MQKIKYPTTNIYIKPEIIVYGICEEPILAGTGLTVDDNESGDPGKADAPSFDWNE